MSKVSMRGVRMDDELYLKLKRIAEMNNRSFNKQAVTIFQQYVAKYEEKIGTIPVNPEELYQ